MRALVTLAQGGTGKTKRRLVLNRKRRLVLNRKHAIHVVGCGGVLRLMDGERHEVPLVSTASEVKVSWGRASCEVKGNLQGMRGED
jgi:hypothetical protein